MANQLISSARLVSQQITAPSCESVQEVVSHLGAMQAQDYNMVKWAMCIRLPGFTDQMIREAADRGEILRTHLLRPTWHFVSAADIHWMLALTAPRIQASVRSMNKQLELTDDVIRKSNAIIENTLAGGKHLTRSELVTELKNNKLPTADNRASHLLFMAELEGITCSGAASGKYQTYALLSERVPAAKMPEREEALAMLAQRYFTSHGPATLKDFTWWSGLSAQDAKNALELIRSEFVAESIGTHTYWMSGALVPTEPEDQVYLVPAFDEFIISYTDRSASLPHKHHSKAVSNNGIFWPVIVINGLVEGTWKRTIKKDKVLVHLHFFTKKRWPRRALKKAAARFGEFSGLKTEVVFPNLTSATA